MATLKLTDFIKFEISLDDVIKICRLLLKRTKDRQVRDALKVMFGELEKTNKSFVKRIFTPLFKIETKKQFKKKFPRIRSKFKQFRAEGKGMLSAINCSLVTDRLQALLEGNNWRKYIPIVNRSLVRLEFTATEWIANDAILVQADQNVMQAINAFMDEIATQKDSDLKGAFTGFKSGLKGIEDSFMRTRKHFATLKVLSGKI
jgi:hypothetical protein